MKRRLWNVTPRFARERLLDAQTRMVNRNLQRQTIPERERDRLREVFKDEVGRLEQRLDRDLSHWLA
jgi:RNA-splicing ligase RtcB